MISSEAKEILVDIENGNDHELTVKEVKVNDDCGHQSGDMVLSAFALKFSDQIKSSDFAFRWGGDEFALLLQIDQQKLLEK